MDLEASDFLHLGGSYPLEVVDVADDWRLISIWILLIQWMYVGFLRTCLRGLLHVHLPLKVVDMAIAAGETDPCRDVLIGGG